MFLDRGGGAVTCTVSSYGARDFYCRDCRVDLFDRQSEHDQHCSRDPDNSDQSCGMVPFHTETMATPAMAMTPLPFLSIRELNDEVLECRIVLRLAGVGRVWNQRRKNNPSPCRLRAREDLCESVAYSPASKVLLVRHPAPHVEIAFATIKGNEAGAEPAAHPRNSAR
jgi:hypothetical protein